MVSDAARRRLQGAVDRLPNDLVTSAPALLERLGVGAAADDSRSPRPSDARPDPSLLDRIPHLRLQTGMVFGWPWRKGVAYLWPRQPHP